MPAVKVHTDELASRLVDEAGRLLSSEGVAAVTLRRVAKEAGTSTTAVYTLFGDKQRLLEAMYREGFTRLRLALEEAEAASDDPLAALAEQGMAYRRAALANPHLYGLMFASAVPGFTPDQPGAEAADAAYAPLVRGVARCLASGALTGGEPERLAFHLWSVSHGVVSLEVAGALPRTLIDPESVYAEALVYAVMPFLPASAPPHDRRDASRRRRRGGS